MSIITTVFTQRLTITTDDNGHVTMQRTSSADTSSAFYFNELTETAQARAISEAIEEEERDYCEFGSYGTSQTGFSVSEIWDAAEELEKAQPIELGIDQGGSPYGTARGSWWHHGANWEAVTEQKHSGTCYSMDICDAWNAYAVRIIALQEGHEDAEERAYIHDENADTAEDNGDYGIAAAERSRAAFYDHMAERIEEVAEELTEEAARAVGNTIDGLIEAEHDYYTSAEFWREWYSEEDERFTRDGERI